MKKCLIIYNQPGIDALPDELDVLDQVKFIGDTLTELGISVSEKGLTEDFFNEIASIENSGYDFVFNLVESVCKQGEILYFIPALLNLHKIPYSGCPVEATFVTASKVLARNIMKCNGIPVAAGFKPSDWTSMIRGNKYILKPVWEDGSLGITEESVFIFNGEKPQIIEDKDDEHWFIEGFIDGREFNVSALAGPNGPEVLPPAEMVFHNYADDIPKIVSYKAKWVEESFQYDNSTRDFPDDISKELQDDIDSTVLKCWKTFGLRGYARVDMRVDENQHIHVLEVNANPCISPDSGFLAACRKAGYSYTYVVSRIIGDLNNHYHGNIF
jgi:D-alanine-D-alanine ligase